MTLDEIKSDFAVLDDWEDRYRYVIELGKALPSLPEALKTEATKVRGCASQVWLYAQAVPGTDGSDPILRFQGDSDAHIVRGLVAILLTAVDNRSARQIAATDIAGLFAELGLADHLTPQRSNGLASMIERIRNDARHALAASAAT